MDSLQVLGVRRYFRNIGIWPHLTVCDPDAWISNFDLGDREIAGHLLAAFVFLNARSTEKLFDVAVRRVVSHELSLPNVDSYLSRWRTLLSRADVSFPSTNPTDSGHLYVRRVRDDFGIDEGQIHQLDELVRGLSEGRLRGEAIILVDDFAGTGDQFVRSINRRFALEGASSPSLADQIASLGIEDCHYIVAVCTSAAKQRIESSTPFRVSAGNVLPATSNLQHEECHLLSPELREDVRSLVERYSERAGIPTPVWGYRDTGLGLAFEHKTPNNTIPLFTWRENGWKPLVNR